LAFWFGRVQRIDFIASNNEMFATLGPQALAVAQPVDDVSVLESRVIFRPV
jgi:hypothetical protein